MLYHTWGAPACSAGLIHDNPARVAESLQLFAMVDVAMRRASEVATPTLLEIVGGLGFASPLMRWLLKALRTTNFESVPPVALEVLHEFWESPLNEKLIEDMLRFLREKEIRNSLHKKVGILECWGAASEHHLFDMYKRSEVAVGEHASVPVPTEFDVDQLCTRKTLHSESSDEE